MWFYSKLVISIRDAPIGLRYLSCYTNGSEVQLTGTQKILGLAQTPARDKGVYLPEDKQRRTAELTDTVLSFIVLLTL